MNGNPFTYDGAGNLLSGDHTWSSNWTYTWNAAGELAEDSWGTEMQTPDKYSYDGLGRLIGDNGNAYFYYGTSDEIAYITDANDNVNYRFTYNQAGLPQFVSLWADGCERVYAYVYDGLGNIAGLVDDNPGSATYGQEVVQFYYDAWGNVLSDTDETDFNLAQYNPFRYKGYLWIPSTGFYYLNARFYDPTTGRFISVDPASITPGDAGSFNDYAYADNNPVMFSDPSGTFPVVGGGLVALELGGEAVPGVDVLATLALAVTAVILADQLIPENGNAGANSGVLGQTVEGAASGQSTVPATITLPSSFLQAQGSRNVEKIGKPKGQAPGPNDVQNKQVQDVSTQLKLTPPQQKELHKQISGQGYGYQEILEIGKQIKGTGKGR